jgi:hypothetical protein
VQVLEVMAQLGAERVLPTVGQQQVDAPFGNVRSSVTSSVKYSPRMAMSGKRSRREALNSAMKAPLLPCRLSNRTMPPV